jgi:hypothetical protein
MSGDVMLHVKQTLDAEQRRSLLAYLNDRLGTARDAHDSVKPHLLFVSIDPAKAPPHAVLDAVRQRGYDARLVDL